MLGNKPELKTIVCENHGEYQERAVQVLDRWMVFSDCEKCIKVERDERAAEARIQEEEQNKRNAYNRRLNAGISKRYIGQTFATVKPQTDTQKKVHSSLLEYSESFSDSLKKHSLILTGGVGTGKTLLASCLIDALIDDFNCVIITCIDLVREMKGTWRRDSEVTERELIDYYATMPLLVIDEVGVQFGTDTERMFIFDVINGRYENELPTVIISNQDITGVRECLGDRVIDRLRQGGGKNLVLSGPSQRK